LTQAPASKPFTQRVRHFLSRPWREHWLFAHAWLLLGWARFTINTIKFETLVNALLVFVQGALPLATLYLMKRIVDAVTASLAAPGSITTC
jgi:hypothetical protein